MGAEEFKDTVLETLRYDKKYAAYKEQLLPIVSRSTFNFIPQYNFTRMPNQRWMTLEFRTPVPLINAANELEETLGDLFSYVYQEDEYYALGDINIRPLLRAGTEPPVENDVAFQDIQDTIIQGIRDAKILIWVAVAWFSNHILFEELLKKQKEGVSIRIIESDEDSNTELLDVMKKHFEVTAIPRFGCYGTNRMHDKFCIIDMEYVMHGSYNWTNAANYNGETLVTSIDRELVKKFAQQFNKMASGLET